MNRLLIAALGAAGCVCLAAAAEAHGSLDTTAAAARARWHAVAAQAQERQALKLPAPLVRIAASEQAAPAAVASYRIGAITIETPWSRATPGGAKVAGGFMRITNSGSAPDRLIGGSSEIAGRFELHESTVKDGIARMHPVEGGLTIRPGETVELKPGSYHVMFVDITRALKEGDVVKGTLVFEKAGTVTVEYRVGGIGAQSTGMGRHHH